MIRHCTLERVGFVSQRYKFRLHCISLSLLLLGKLISPKCRSIDCHFYSSNLWQTLINANHRNARKKKCSKRIRKTKEKQKNALMLNNNTKEFCRRNLICKYFSEHCLHMHMQIEIKLKLFVLYCKNFHKILRHTHTHCWQRKTFQHIIKLQSNTAKQFQLCPFVVTFSKSFFFFNFSIDAVVRTEYWIAQHVLEFVVVN